MFKITEKDRPTKQVASLQPGDAFLLDDELFLVADPGSAPSAWLGTTVLTVQLLNGDVALRRITCTTEVVPVEITAEWTYA